ncbi:MAG: 4'-phosphopantetheinyl transferase superfamily protein [Schleiferiaceae bacterium]|jgi:4'-phosphopantetheinyl transferase EntD|nr:4'-phosphopantetheinyl transferase superfamily protein [Schleiferiaceae bacterium]
MKDAENYLNLYCPEKGVEIALFPVEKAGLLNDSFLPPKDKERFDLINHPQKKAEFLSSRFALNALVPNYKLNYDGRRPDLASGEHVSLTHCTQYGGAMYGHDKRVGLDVELHRPELTKIARKFVRIDEKRYIIPGEELFFYQVLWSGKEALFKLWKKGNVYFKEDLKIEPFDVVEDGITHAQIFKDEIIKCKIHFSVLDGAYLVYAIEE